MIYALTPKQRECLDWLRRRLSETGGTCPSYDEIAEGLGLGSKSGVNRLLVAVEERGRIRRLPQRARAIEVVDAPPVADVAGLSDAELRALGARVAAEMAARLGAGVRS